jgi:hypothetical protein
MPELALAFASYTTSWDTTAGPEPEREHAVIGQVSAPAADEAARAQSSFSPIGWRSIAWACA